MRRLALECAVAGSATNLDDGSVDVVLEGPRRAVEELIAYCADGPEYARVSRVEVSEEESQGISGFETA